MPTRRLQDRDASVGLKLRQPEGRRTPCSEYGDDREAPGAVRRGGRPAAQSEEADRSAAPATTGMVRSAVKPRTWTAEVFAARMRPSSVLGRFSEAVLAIAISTSAPAVELGCRTQQPRALTSASPLLASVKESEDMRPLGFVRAAPVKVVRRNRLEGLATVPSTSGAPLGPWGPVAPSGPVAPLGPVSAALEAWLSLAGVTAPFLGGWSRSTSVRAAPTPSPPGASSR